jgi:hypothetical protein
LYLCTACVLPRSCRLYYPRASHTISALRIWLGCDTAALHSAMLSPLLLCLSCSQICWCSRCLLPPRAIFQPALRSQFCGVLRNAAAHNCCYSDPIDAPKPEADPSEEARGACSQPLCPILSHRPYIFAGSQHFRGCNPSLRPPAAAYAPQIVIWNAPYS